MAKTKFPNDDLFEGTKMSFGEHLEELRVCLFKAVIGLAIGFALGLCVAGYVVDWIQRPLKTAMEKHSLDKAVRDLKKQYGENAVSPAIEDFIRKHHVLYEDAYIETQELARVASVARQHGPVPKPGEPDANSPSGAESSSPPVPATNSPAAAVPSNTADAPSPNDVRPSPGDAVAATTGKKGTGTKGEKGVANTSEVTGSPLLIADKPPTPNSEMIPTRFWRPIKLSVTSLRADEAFMIWLKAGFVAGFVLASPYVFVQIWNFVAAGLYPHEKSYVHIFLPFSLLLFLSGASLAYFFVFEPVLSFLFSFNESMNIGIDARISEWLGFVLIMPLGFGLSFQLPLVMLFLNRIGIFSVKAYMEKWRIAILAVFVISMVLTPADPISMLLMALPLTALYFLGVGLCRWMPRGKNPFSEAYEP